jgi:hypothetical protein
MKGINLSLTQLTTRTYPYCKQVRAYCLLLTLKSKDDFVLILRLHGGECILFLVHRVAQAPGQIFFIY